MDQQIVDQLVSLNASLAAAAWAGFALAIIGAITAGVLTVKAIW